MSHGLLLFIIVSYFSILFFYNVIFLHASQMGLTQHFKHTIYIFFPHYYHIKQSSSYQELYVPCPF